MKQFQPRLLSFNGPREERKPGVLEDGEDIVAKQADLSLEILRLRNFSPSFSGDDVASNPSGTDSNEGTDIGEEFLV